MATMTAKQAKAVAERYTKAVALVNEGKVYRLYGGHEGDYVVVNGEGVAYLTNVISGECTCPDSQYRCARLDILCKHALAALIVHEQAQPATAEQTPPPEPEPEPEDALPAAWCQGCGVALDSGELCRECGQRELARIRRDVELAAEFTEEQRKARELLEHLF